MKNVKPNHLEILAKEIHERWMNKRLEEGWTFGLVRNDELKQHPCLVPYEKLSEIEKEYDKAIALETIKSLDELGYKLLKKNSDDQNLV